MKRKLYIPFLFICLVSANLVHDSIPHHHHNDDLLTHEGCRDQCSDRSGATTGSPATHCHAFNDMQYFPVTESTKVIPLEYFGNDLFTFPGASEPAANWVCTVSLPMLGSVPYSTPEPEKTSPRAPPSA